MKGSCYDDTESDYYGLLDDVLEVEYHSSLGRCVVVLFKCHWFDHVRGVKVNHKHNMVDIKHKTKGFVNDPYVLASQVVQVYYVPYPSMTNDLKDWWAVVKTKPRGIYEVDESVTEVVDDENLDGEDFFQENERFVCNTTIDSNEGIEPVSLVTPEVIQEVGANESDNSDEDGDQEEEFEDISEDSNEDDDLNLSDHTSDE